MYFTCCKRCHCHLLGTIEAIERERELCAIKLLQKPKFFVFTSLIWSMAKTSYFLDSSHILTLLFVYTLINHYIGIYCYWICIAHGFCHSNDVKWLVQADVNATRYYVHMKHEHVHGVCVSLKCARKKLMIDINYLIYWCIWMKVFGWIFFCRFLENFVEIVDWWVRRNFEWKELINCSK